MAMEACQAINVAKRSCWIGLNRPFTHWDDGTDAEKFSNWAPGEPNDAGYNEDCTEMYAKNGRWNDLACSARRYFLCNARTVIQRMDTEKRKKMILKRLRRHKSTWKRYRRIEYRKKIRKQYREKMMKYMKEQRKKQRAKMMREREMLRQRSFKNMYGGFMGKMNIGPTRAMDKYGGMSPQSGMNNMMNMGRGFPKQNVGMGGLNAMKYDKYSMKSGMQNGWIDFRGQGMRRRRMIMQDYIMDKLLKEDEIEIFESDPFDEFDVDPNEPTLDEMDDPQEFIDALHDRDDGRIPWKKRLEMDMNMDEFMEMDTFGVGEFDDLGDDEDDDIDIDIKCTFFSSLHGLFELCIDSEGIDVKKYLKKRVKGFDDRNDGKVVYVKNMTNSSGLVENEDDWYDDDDYGYLNYMEYEDLKYKLAVRYDNITMTNLDYNDNDRDNEYKDDALDESENDDIDNYHLRLDSFIYDFDSNHNKQCWKYLYEFSLCFEPQHNDDNDDNEEYDMLIEISKSRKIVFPSKFIRFNNDLEWDEINLIHNTEENRKIITKCIHIFDAKICIECRKEINDLNDNLPLSYIANVLIHDDQLSQESL